MNFKIIADQSAEMTSPWSWYISKIERLNTLDKVELNNNLLVHRMCYKAPIKAPNQSDVQPPHKANFKQGLAVLSTEC